MTKYSNLLVESPKEFGEMTLFRYQSVHRLIKGKAVLELGSGLGEGAAFLARGAKRVLGIDYSRQAVVQARQRFKLKNLKFRLGDALKVKMKNKFDVIIAFELLEHLEIEKQINLVSLMRQWLEPGGMMVVSTPNRMVFSKGKRKSRHPFHKHELTIDELRQLFEKEFKAVKIRGIECANQGSVNKRRRLEAGWWHKMIDWWAGFGWVHRLLPLIPKRIKGLVSGEGSLPELRADDYQLIDERVEKCEDFWLEARV